jgi:hypothetical protein
MEPKDDNVLRSQKEIDEAKARVQSKLDAQQSYWQASTIQLTAHFVFVYRTESGWVADPWKVKVKRGDVVAWVPLSTDIVNFFPYIDVFTTDTLTVKDDEVRGLQVAYGAPTGSAKYIIFAMQQQGSIVKSDEGDEPTIIIDDD